MNAPGMMPILHSPGHRHPGSSGRSRARLLVQLHFHVSISSVGIPSVMVIISLDAYRFPENGVFTERRRT